MKVGTISDELLDRIKLENNIREVIEEYGIKINSTNKARCPFHKEGKTPNLHVYENSYHCYTCRAGTKWEDKDKRKPHILTLPDKTEIEDGGPNVIGFVMNIERCSYVEACVILMERAGIPVPKAKVNVKEEREKKKLTTLNKNFCQALFNNKIMMKYLADRGIFEESIKKWRLGFVPKNHNHYLFGKRVAGRLVFGLTEDSWNPKKAKTIAMAYRAMTEAHQEDAKYLNDYNSTIYNKSQYLYGFNEARKSIKQHGYAIVMEGYIDVIISHQSGIENAVATCGTAFTDEQIDKLKKVTNKIVFWYDGDNAGFDAMINNIEKLLAKGLRVMMIDSSPMDPAELMNDMGQDSDRIKQYIRDHAQPALHVIMNMTIDEYQEEIRTYENRINESKVAALDELLPLVDQIKHDADRIVFKDMIAKKLNINL